MKDKVREAAMVADEATKGKKHLIGGGLAGAGAGSMIGGVGVAGAFGAFGIPALVVVGATALAGVGVAYGVKKTFEKLRS
jgi:hypothetical protein